MQELSYHGWVLVLDLAHLISFCVCLLIWRRLRVLNETVKQRLFVKQITHLVKCDLVGVVSGTLLSLLYLANNAAKEKGGNANLAPPFWLFVAVGSFAQMAAVTSILLEFHLCCGFACGYFQWRRPLPILRKIIPLAWPLGACSVVGDQVLTAIYETACVDLTLMFLTAANIVLCALLYIAVCVHVLLWRRPRVVELKVFTRAWGYPLNFFLTFAPMLSIMIMSDLGIGFDGRGFFLWWWRVVAQDEPFTYPWWYWVAYVLLGLNGALNGVMYGISSGPLWSQRRFRITEHPNTQSDNASVGGVLAVPLDASARVPPPLRRDVSMHVHFGLCETVAVSTITPTDDSSFISVSSSEDDFPDEFWAGFVEVPVIDEFGRPVGPHF